MAGKGTRLNAGINKVFLELEGKPLFSYSLKILEKFCDSIVLVIREEELSFIKPFLSNRVKYVYGGSERFLSVNEGIKATNSDYVLIHDGARPFINEEMLKEAVHTKENQMFCGRVKDTIYQGSNLNLVDRESLIAAKTPQIINKEEYLYSFAKAIENDFKPTDEISLLSKYIDNFKVKLYYDEMNFKVTTKIDYLLAKEVLKCIE